MWHGRVATHKSFLQSDDVKVSYKVPYSGEYYILDGENKENITDRVIVEHEGGAEDNMKISQ